VAGIGHGHQAINGAMKNRDGAGDPFDVERAPSISVGQTIVNVADHTAGEHLGNDRDPPGQEVWPGEQRGVCRIGCDRAARQDLLAALTERIAANGTRFDLLSAVTDSAQLPDVFDRISRATQTVLAHDALVLTAVLPGGASARVYAQIAPKGHELPEIVQVPPKMQRDPGWDHDVVDDLLAQSDQQGLDATKAGYRSVLRVAIRLEGEYAAGLSFASLSPNAFSDADVPAARRIADRITLSFARERTRALARQADEASVRAERLESRVRALTDELNARSGYHGSVHRTPRLAARSGVVHDRVRASREWRRADGSAPGRPRDCHFRRPAATHRHNGHRGWIL
jgi:hypothetical protein